MLALAAVWFFAWFWLLLAGEVCGFSLEASVPWLLGFGESIRFAWAFPTWANLPLSAICLGLAYGVYRLSLYPQAQYGEFYKSLFDQHRSRLQHQDVLEYLAQATGDRNLAAADFKQANMALWRYLRWHKARPSGQDENRNLEVILQARRDEGAPAAAHVSPTLRRTRSVG